MNTFSPTLFITSLTAVLSLSSAGAFALLAGTAAAAADETFVVDRSAGTDARGALFRVDAISGDRSLVSDFGNAAQGPVGPDPVGLALEAAGTVLVIDFDEGTGFNGALFRVDAISGNRSLVSDFGNAAQGPLGAEPFGLGLEAGGTVLVIDEDAGTGGLGALEVMDRAVTVGCDAPKTDVATSCFGCVSCGAHPAARAGRLSYCTVT